VWRARAGQRSSAQAILVPRDPLYSARAQPIVSDRGALFSISGCVMIARDLITPSSRVGGSGSPLNPCMVASA
jgi:hypothetical protein